MTGNIGKPGTGANSITGQCNAMGSRLFSNTTNLLGGHNFSNSKDRKKVAEILGIEEELIPDRASLAYDQILEQIEEGHIKFLWIVATNPFHSWIDQKKWEILREKLDFLVVQDLYADTLTAVEADLFFPAAGWGEKEGVMINSERRIGKLNPVSTAPGSAKTDFEIFLKIAEKFELDWMKDSFGSPEKAFETLKKLSIGQPCDISGIRNYEEIEVECGIQWPVPISGCKSNRLFEDGKYYHKNLKARFCFDKPEAPPVVTSKNYPFILLTGRGSSTQWHTGTRTGRSPLLKRISPKEVYVEINPKQAEKLKITEDDWVQVTSQQGMIKAKALPTNQVKEGEVFIPMHYSQVNSLLALVVDSESRQPSYKFTPVNIQLISKS